MSYSFITAMLSIWTGLGEDSNDSVSDTDCSLDEEAIIAYYFKGGFDYNEILLFLVKHHDRTLVSISFLFMSLHWSDWYYYIFFVLFFLCIFCRPLSFFSTFWSEGFRVLGMSTLGAGSAGNMKLKIPLVNRYSSKSLWKYFTVFAHLF